MYVVTTLTQEHALLSNADVQMELHKASQYEGIAPHILNFGGKW